MPEQNVPLLDYLKRASAVQLANIEKVMSVDSLRNCAYGSRKVSAKNANKLEKVTNGELTRKMLRSDWADIWSDLTVTKKGKK